MTNAFIIDAVRSPVGRRGRALAEGHPLDLTAASNAALVNRLGVDSVEYDEVILGCIDQLGPQSIDIARNAWLAPGARGRCPAPRWSASAARASRPSTTQPRR